MLMNMFLLTQCWRKMLGKIIDVFVICVTLEDLKLET